MNLQGLWITGVDGGALNAPTFFSPAAEFAAILEHLVLHLQDLDPAVIGKRLPELLDRPEIAQDGQGVDPAAGAETPARGSLQPVPTHEQPVGRVTGQVGPEAEGDHDQSAGKRGTVRWTEESPEGRRREEPVIPSVLIPVAVVPVVQTELSIGEDSATSTTPAATVRDAATDVAEPAARSFTQPDAHTSQEFPDEAVHPWGHGVVVEPSRGANSSHGAIGPHRGGSAEDPPRWPIAPDRTVEGQRTPAVAWKPTRTSGDPGVPERTAVAVRPVHGGGLPAGLGKATLQADPDDTAARVLGVDPVPLPVPEQSPLSGPGSEGSVQFSRFHFSEGTLRPEGAEIAVDSPRSAPGTQDAEDPGRGAGDRRFREDPPEAEHPQAPWRLEGHASMAAGQKDHPKVETSSNPPGPEVRTWPEHPELQAAPRRLQVEVPDAWGDPVKVDVRARSEAVWVRVEGSPEVAQALRDDQLHLQHALAQHGLSLEGLEVDTLPRSRRGPEDLPLPLGHRASLSRRPSAVRVVEGSVDYVV